MGWRSNVVVCVVLLSACGPVVDGEGDGSEGESTGTAPTSDPSTTGVGPNPTTAQDVATSDDPPVLDLGEPPATLDGVYLLAVAAVIDPAHPLQWLASVEQEKPSAGGHGLTIVLQSLSLEVGSTNAPREPVGEPLEIHGAFEPDGSFWAETPTVVIPGAANPITGSEIGASMVLEGTVSGRESWCGQVSGQVTQPLMLDLAGSTFAFTPVDGALPDPVTAACPG